MADELVIDASAAVREAVALAEDADALAAGMRQRMELSLAMAHSAVVGYTPVGATGILRGSITTEITGTPLDLTGTVFSQDLPVKVASVEHGRAPGRMPPAAALLPWVRSKWGGDMSDAWLVARAIGRRGTRGAHMFERAYNDVQARIVALWDDLPDVLRGGR